MILRRYSDDPTALDPRVVCEHVPGHPVDRRGLHGDGLFRVGVDAEPTVAAMFSYALGLRLFLLSLRALRRLHRAGWAVKVYNHIAMTQHLEQFARGMIDTRVLVYYVSLTAVLPVPDLESRGEPPLEMTHPRRIGVASFSPGTSDGKSGLNVAVRSWRWRHSAHGQLPGGAAFSAVAMDVGRAVSTLACDKEVLRSLTNQVK